MGRKITLVGVLIMVLALQIIYSQSQSKSIYDDLPTVKVSSIISISSDDAEEKLSTNSVNLTSSDLELISNAGNDQIVGLRFNNINIPQGATITKAHISFQADETANEWTNLILSAEAVDHAKTFNKQEANISSRVQTAASVNWSGMDPWTSLNDSHLSPDLAAVLQEVVDRRGWEKNNSVAIFIEGSGGRTAEAFDGSPQEAPLLIIEYLKNNSYSFNSDDATLKIGINLE